MKNTSSSEDLSWAQRIKEYNSVAEGNVERFSIPSDEESDQELPIDDSGNSDGHGNYS